MYCEAFAVKCKANIELTYNNRGRNEFLPQTDENGKLICDEDIWDITEYEQYFLKGAIHMGLLKAGVGALSGVLADSWRDYFYCDSLDADVLAAKGEKRAGGRSSNKKGKDNIISNGSIINVNDGQCMIIVESGKVVDVCAEPGEFVYDTGTEPSIFYGDLGQSIKKSFEQIEIGRAHV